jgi:hypothetical protein
LFGGEKKPEDLINQEEQEGDEQAGQKEQGQQLSAPSFRLIGLTDLHPIGEKVLPFGFIHKSAPMFPANANLQGFGWGRFAGIAWKAGPDDADYPPNRWEMQPQWLFEF